jgi:hypothetical protein
VTAAQRRKFWQLQRRDAAAYTRLIEYVNRTDKRGIAARTRAAEDMAAAAFQIVALLHQIEKAAKK